MAIVSESKKGEEEEQVFVEETAHEARDPGASAALLSSQKLREETGGGLFLIFVFALTFIAGVVWDIVNTVNQLQGVRNS